MGDLAARVEELHERLGALDIRPPVPNELLLRAASVLGDGSLRLADAAVEQAAIDEDYDRRRYELVAVTDELLVRAEATGSWEHLGPPGWVPPRGPAPEIAVRAVRLDRVVAVEVVGEDYAWQHRSDQPPAGLRPGMRWRLVVSAGGQADTAVTLPLGPRPTLEQTLNAHAAARLALLGQAHPAHR